MYYKENWENVRERYELFWEGRLNEPLVAITAPLEKPIRKIEPLPVPPEIAKLKTDHYYARALNPEFAVNRAEIEFARTFYGGEALPYRKAMFGPDMTASYLGVEPQFKKDTTWFRNPVIDDWHDLPDFKYDENNKWWEITKNLAKELAEKGKGRFFSAIAGVLEGLDTLVSLRGGTKLLADLIDYPEEVKNLTSHISDLEIRWYEKLYQITQKGQEGSVCWFGVWSPEKLYAVQCDFADMISPSMFEEFALPSIKKFCRYLDHSIYHLDGKGQIAHLDILLNIKELDGIQWSVPVIPVDPPHDSEVWYPYFKRIQKAGKLLVIYWARPENVERLISDLSPEGLYISTSCESEKEAKELLNKAKIWTKKSLKRKN